MIYKRITFFHVKILLKLTRIVYIFTVQYNYVIKNLWSPHMDPLALASLNINTMVKSVYVERYTGKKHL